MHHAERSGPAPPHHHDAPRGQRDHVRLSPAEREPADCGRDRPRPRQDRQEMDADTLGLVSDYSVDGKLPSATSSAAWSTSSSPPKRRRRTPGKALLLQHWCSPPRHSEYGSPLAPKFPEAEVLNTIDTLDARLYEMDEALSRAIPGGFSERSGGWITASSTASPRTSQITKERWGSAPYPPKPEVSGLPSLSLRDKIEDCFAAITTESRSTSGFL